MPHPASDVDPAQQLRQRRASVEEVYQAIEALGPEADPGAVATLVSDALEASPLDELAHLRGGRERIVAQAVEDYRRFAPSEASNASSAAGLVRILLLQNVDLLWWEDVDDFDTAADARAAGALREVLLDYLDRGVLNVIDEGRAWHICLSPDHAARYARKD